MADTRQGSQREDKPVPAAQERSAGRSRAIGYVRVSTRGQAEHGMGLAAQRDRVAEYARAKGYALAEIVSESASGGRRGDEVFSWEHRPALLELLDRAQRREFDVLVVSKLDRLSRDHTTLVVLERQLQRHGVAVESVAEEQNGDGALAEFIRGQLALVAQLERSMILDRVLAGKAKRKAQGRHVHGRIPYGYTSASGLLTPDDSTADVVRRIFADARQGDAPGRIARALNSERIPSPSGASWSTKAVTRIIQNLVYAGERYGVKQAHPSLVNRRTFNAANRALRARGAAWALKRGAPEQEKGL